MQVLRVRDFMTTKLHVVTPDADIMDAASQLVELNISGLLVVEGDTLVGMLTERDLIDVALKAGYHDESGGQVRDYMSGDVQTVEADANLIDIAEIFATQKFRRFPVMENGRLAGLIARRDVLRALVSGAWFTSHAR